MVLLPFWRSKPEPSGATLDWSPAREIGEDPELARVMVEHDLDPFDESDRSYALDLLKLRADLDGAVAAWARGLEARLDAWAPGWQLAG
ncbi:hypothetical protein [Micromonospora sp. NBC_01813]|uniref:hypothetical protein n=1 Tax=Micromonospora sp. NBC_01813 TaxID=2975988 RepID=UPI002DD9F34D|nr:hypothetical protein [Micromonospora sp. NBC_01813]WSA11526.1 hypothetical protein OG958_12510 [Micromonospora sp. NBC_01813]